MSKKIIQCEDVVATAPVEATEVAEEKKPARKKK